MKRAICISGLATLSLFFCADCAPLDSLHDHYAWGDRFTQMQQHGATGSGGSYEGIKNGYKERGYNDREAGKRAYYDYVRANREFP